MTEEQLSHLSIDEKMKAVRFLIADLAANILSEDAVVKDKARHEIGSLAMTFSNLHQLITSSPTDNLAVVRSIYNRYRYQAPTNQETNE
jgi:hypothetical protein